MEPTGRAFARAVGAIRVLASDGVESWMMRERDRDPEFAPVVAGGKCRTARNHGDDQGERRAGEQQTPKGHLLVSLNAKPDRIDARKKNRCGVRSVRSDAENTPTASVEM
jgi:hypothetical protein